MTPLVQRDRPTPLKMDITRPDTQLPVVSLTSLIGADSETTGPDEDVSESLIDRLDRRQNQVLADLDTLNVNIERLVAQCQHVRQPH